MLEDVCTCVVGRDVVKLLWEQLLGFDDAKWESLFHDSTSPIPAKRIPNPALVDQGLGGIGVVRIPSEVWNATIPESFSQAWEEPIHTKPMSVEASTMLDCNTLTKKYPEMFMIDNTGTLVGMAKTPKTHPGVPLYST